MRREDPGLVNPVGTDFIKTLSKSPSFQESFLSNSISIFFVKLCSLYCSKLVSHFTSDLCFFKKLVNMIKGFSR